MHKYYAKTHYIAIALMAGFFSPSLNAGASAALGGGAAHVGGGGMHMPMGGGGMHIPVNRTIHIPKIQRPVRPMRPVNISNKPLSTKPVSKPVSKPVQTAPHKPVKPVKKPEQLKPHHNRPSHHYHPHHNHDGHHHGHFHYPYHNWDNYWGWFWASNIVIGAIVSTIPDNECQDVTIDDKNYKECNGVLFEPVYQNDTWQYEVSDIQK